MVVRCLGRARLASVLVFGLAVIGLLGVAALIANAGREGGDRDDWVPATGDFWNPPGATRAAAVTLEYPKWQTSGSWLLEDDRTLREYLLANDQRIQFALEISAKGPHVYEADSFNMYPVLEQVDSPQFPATNWLFLAMLVHCRLGEMQEADKYFQAFYKLHSEIISRPVPLSLITAVGKNSDMERALLNLLAKQNDAGTRQVVEGWVRKMLAAPGMSTREHLGGSISFNAVGRDATRLLKDRYRQHYKIAYPYSQKLCDAACKAEFRDYATLEEQYDDWTVAELVALSGFEEDRVLATRGTPVPMDRMRRAIWFRPRYGQFLASRLRLASVGVYVDFLEYLKAGGEKSEWQPDYKKWGFDVFVKKEWIAPDSLPDDRHYSDDSNGGYKFTYPAIDLKIWFFEGEVGSFLPYPNHLSDD